MSETKYRTCNLCEALCGIEVVVEDNRAVSIRGDKNDVFSKGHICPKAVALIDIHEDPNRLKEPIKKINNQWQKISWEEAFDEIAERVFSIQNENGNDAVAIYQGNPSVHNLGTSLFSPQFVRSLQTKNRYSATSVDQLAHHLAGEYMLGHQFLVPVPDINRTDFWLILGGNPIVSNGSLMTVANVSGKMKSIQKKGGKIVVVDPRFTETAKRADAHYFIQPGTDLFLLLSMIQIVFEEDLVNLGHLEKLIELPKIKSIKEVLSTIDLDEASEITGIPGTQIRQLTRDFCRAKSAVCYGRLGVSASRNGGLCHWAINVLNILTGNFDRPGGSMLSNPIIDLSKARSKNKKFRRWKSRVRGLPEFGGELPSATLAEDILTPGDGQIKALITSCGNPVLSVPNGKKLDEAFQQLDFMVSIDIYLNETTRHADIILPPATGLETPHYGLAFHNLAIHNFAKYSEPTLEKTDGSKSDWEIFTGLKNALQKKRGEEINDSPLDLETTLDMMLQFSAQGMSLARLKKYPHGIDLGPHVTNLEKRIKTSNEKIDIFPDIYEMALKDVLIEGVTREGLRLIGRRHLRSNNSWLHNSLRMLKGPERCTLLIHPIDAANHKIENGENVKVKSRVGEVSIKAEISDEMMKGVVSIPHGWGHWRKGVSLDVATTRPGVSMNDLVDDSDVDPLSAVAIISDIPITLHKINVPISES